MLRVNVGLSRKLTKDYNSSGYSINFDGEITASPTDAEAVIEQVKELFDLAEEALDQQIERSSSDDAFASRDQQQGSHGDGRRQQPAAGNGRTTSSQPAHDSRQDEELATNKQIQYLLNIGKHQRLSTAQLERKVADILGRHVGLYDLTKRAAAVAIEALTQPAGNGQSQRR